MTFPPNPETEAGPKNAITEEERARRLWAVNYARGSMRLSGFVLSEFMEDLNRRYVAGEISSEQKTAMVLAYHGMPDEKKPRRRSKSASRSKTVRNAPA